MTSAFGWLDNDDAQRGQMMEAVKLFQDQSSVDELGIGSVRDAFSDSFFPGTSVLHTRVRHLLFIPWLLREMARKGWSLERSRKELRSSEVRLIRSLLAGGETRGVTGSQAQERLKTMPSAPYWPALGRLRLRRWDVSIDGYFRATSQGAKRVAEVGEDDEGSRHDLGLEPSIPSRPRALSRDGPSRRRVDSPGSGGEGRLRRRFGVYRGRAQDGCHDVRASGPGRLP